MARFRKDGVLPITRASSCTPIRKPKAVSPPLAALGRSLHGKSGGSGRPPPHGHRRDAGGSHPDSHHVPHANRESNLRTPTANATKRAATRPPKAPSTPFEPTTQGRSYADRQAMEAGTRSRFTVSAPSWGFLSTIDRSSELRDGGFQSVGWPRIRREPSYPLRIVVKPQLRSQHHLAQKSSWVPGIAPRHPPAPPNVWFYASGGCTQPLGYPRGGYGSFPWESLSRMRPSGRWTISSTPSRLEAGRA